MTNGRSKGRMRRARGTERRKCGGKLRRRYGEKKKECQGPPRSLPEQAPNKRCMRKNGRAVAGCMKTIGKNPEVYDEMKVRLEKRENEVLEWSCKKRTSTR
jgi:hypothetical protein